MFLVFSGSWFWPITDVVFTSCYSVFRKFDYELECSRTVNCWYDLCFAVLLYFYANFETDEERKVTWRLEKTMFHFQNLPVRISFSTVCDLFWFLWFVFLICNWFYLLNETKLAWINLKVGLFEFVFSLLSKIYFVRI